MACCDDVALCDVALCDVALCDKALCDVALCDIADVCSDDIGGGGSIAGIAWNTSSGPATVEEEPVAADMERLII